MITKNHVYLLLICLLLVGCIPTARTASVTTLTSTVTTTPLPTTTAALFPTDTPTPLPTLEPEHAEQAIRDLFLNNLDCLAPCFMGAVSGKTTFEEVNTIFAHLGLRMDQTASENNIEYYATSYKFDSGLSIRIRLHIKSGIAQGFNIPITLPQDQSPPARDEWLAYLPESLIRQYGMPSKVNFFAGRGPTPSYLIDLYFDTYDLIVEYESYDLDRNLEICPLTDQFMSIGMWIGKNPIYPPLETVPLEKATSMTMEEFSELMIGDSSKACFNLKQEAFP